MANCCTWINACGEVETQLHEITEQVVGLTKWLLQQGLYFTYLILTGLGLGRPWAPKYIVDIGNFPAYNHHSSLPDTLYSLKSFLCMFTATDYPANGLPKTRTSDKE